MHVIHHHHVQKKQKERALPTQTHLKCATSQERSVRISRAGASFVCVLNKVNSSRFLLTHVRATTHSTRPHLIPHPVPCTPQAQPPESDPRAPPRPAHPITMPAQTSPLPRPPLATHRRRALLALAALLGAVHVPEATAFLPTALPSSLARTGTCQASSGFGKRALVVAAATANKNKKGSKGSKGSSSGLRGDVLRSGSGTTRSSSGPRPSNDTSGSAGAGAAAFDPKNPFYTSEFGEDEPVADATAAAPETEAEKAKRLQEEDEWLLNFSRDDPDSYTETYSQPEERKARAQATKDRYDFTCLTVEEVARSYQVPISWIGDALCNFGVVPPIQWTARMGDLIDGEQAFALLEAMHGWDHAIMYDMYTWDSLRELVDSYDLEMSEVLQVCDEEKFALPFGLRSHLRIEQFARLMRRLGLARELPDHIKAEHPDPDYPNV